MFFWLILFIYSVNGIQVLKISEYNQIIRDNTWNSKYQSQIVNYTFKHSNQSMEHVRARRFLSTYKFNIEGYIMCGNRLEETYDKELWLLDDGKYVVHTNIDRNGFFSLKSDTFETFGTMTPGLGITHRCELNSKESDEVFSLNKWTVDKWNSDNFLEMKDFLVVLDRAMGKDHDRFNIAILSEIVCPHDWRKSLNASVELWQRGAKQSLAYAIPRFYQRNFVANGIVYIQAKIVDEPKIQELYFKIKHNCVHGKEKISEINLTDPDLSKTARSADISAWPTFITKVDISQDELMTLKYNETVIP